MKYGILVFSCLLLSILSCKKKSEEQSTGNPQDNQAPVLANIGEHLILASYQQLVVDCDSLKSKSAAFCNAPTAGTLQEAQQAWKKAKLSWKQCEVFNFGPADSLLIGYVIDYLLINTSKIESNISTPATPDDIDEAYINTRSSTAKGLTALEYLLFDRTDNNTIITNFSSSTSFEKRKAYLNGLCHNLFLKANVIHNEWSPSGKNYLATFKNNPRRDNLGSLSLLVNGLVVMSDVVKTVRVGTPLGKVTGTPDPSSVEAYYSKYSFACIKADFNCFQYLMTGAGFGTMNGKGLNTLLNSRDDHKTIYNDIIVHLTSLITDAETFPISLEQAAQNNDADVSTFYDSTQTLVRLFKGSLCPALNVTVSFSDNDGD